LNDFEDDDPDNPVVKGPDGNPMPRNPHKAEMAFITFRKELVKTRTETEEFSVKYERVRSTHHHFHFIFWFLCVCSFETFVLLDWC
jgi:hypothetical protein